MKWRDRDGLLLLNWLKLRLSKCWSQVSLFIFSCSTRMLIVTGKKKFDSISHDDNHYCLCIRAMQ